MQYNQESWKSPEFLDFSLGDNAYGIGILKVQEIRGYKTVTKIANTSDFIKGIINLRGIIGPQVDRRIKFQMANVEFKQCPVVILLNRCGRVFGIVVDGLSDVFELTPEKILAVPVFGSSLDTIYLVVLGTSVGV